MNVKNQDGTPIAILIFITEELYLFNSLLDLPNPTLLQKILDQLRFPNSPVWGPRVICLKFDLLMGI